MVAPVIAAALIGGIAKLFGGALDRKQRQKDAYNNSPKGIRESFEAAGFNPLLGPLGGANSNANYAPVMGTAIANAGSAFAGGIYDNEQLKIEKAALQQDRERLDHMLESTILQPSVAGIYGNNGREEFPNNPSSPIGEAPVARPSFANAGYIPVIMPDGTEQQLNKGYADRLDLKPFDQIILEDFEAWFGDEGGQVVGSSQIAGALWKHGGGFRVPKANEPNGEPRRGFFDAAKDFVTFVTGEGYWASPPSPTQPTLKLNANPAFGY